MRDHEHEKHLDQFMTPTDRERVIAEQMNAYRNACEIYQPEAVGDASVLALVGTAYDAGVKAGAASERAECVAEAQHFHSIGALWPWSEDDPRSAGFRDVRHAEWQGRMKERADCASRGCMWCRERMKSEVSP